MKEEPVVGAHRLQDTEVAHVVDDKAEECLPNDSHANQKAESYCHSEVDRYSGVFHEVAHRESLELISGIRRKPRLFIDLKSNLFHVVAWAYFGQDK